MGLRELAQQDFANITSNLNEFGLQITFTTPDGNTSVQVNGIEAKIYMQFDFDSGKEVNAQKARVTVSEKFLSQLNYPVRNLAGKVSMKKHQVSYIDGTGTTCNFQVAENLPDETVGTITFILSEIL